MPADGEVAVVPVAGQATGAHGGHHDRNREVGRVDLDQVDRGLEVDRAQHPLVAGGLPADTPAAVIMSATTPEERIVTAGIADLPRRAREHGMGSPALIVVGDIVRMREEFMRPSRSGQTA